MRMSRPKLKLKRVASETKHNRDSTKRGKNHNQHCVNSLSDIHELVLWGRLVVVVRGGCGCDDSGGVCGGGGSFIAEFVV